MSRSRTFTLLAAAAFCAAAVPFIRAAPAQAIVCEVTWVNNEGGRWDEAVNWSTGVVPTYEDDVCLWPIDREMSVLIDAPHAVGSLHIAYGVALLLDGRANHHPLGASTPEFFSFGDVTNEGTIVIDRTDPEAPLASFSVETGAALYNLGFLEFHDYGHSLNGTVVNALGAVVRLDHVYVTNGDAYRPLHFINFGTVEGDHGVLVSQNGTIVNRGVVAGANTFLVAAGEASSYEHRATVDSPGWAQLFGGVLRIAEPSALSAFVLSPDAFGGDPATSARIEGDISPAQYIALYGSGDGFPTVFATDTVNAGRIHFTRDNAEFTQVAPGRTLTNRGTMQLADAPFTRRLQGQLVNEGVIDLHPEASLSLDTATTLRPDSWLDFGVAGPTVYSYLHSWSSIALGGSMRLNVPAGVALASGQSYEVVRASSITGTFSDVVLPTLPAGLSWNVNYAATSVTISIV